MVNKNDEGGIELTKEEARNLILFDEKGKKAHTFNNTPIGLLGADHSKESLFKDIKDAEMLQLAGEQSQGMGHALVIAKKLPCLQSDLLFVETKEEEVNKLNEIVKNLE